MYVRGGLNEHNTLVVVTVCLGCLSMFIAGQKKFTKRQKLCYTAIVKFAVTNWTWDIETFRRKMKTFIYVDNPLSLNQTARLFDDQLSAHYLKMVDYIQNTPIYDPANPYMQFDWYVHAEDPNYRQRFSRRPWNPSGEAYMKHRAEWLAEFRRKKKREEAAKRKRLSAVGRRSTSGRSKTPSETPPLPIPIYSNAATPECIVEETSSSRSSESRVLLMKPVSHPPSPIWPAIKYEQPPEVAAQPSHKSVVYYRKASVTYYKNHRDMGNRTVREFMVSLNYMSALRILVIENAFAMFVAQI